MSKKTTKNTSNPTTPLNTSVAAGLHTGTSDGNMGLLSNASSRVSANQRSTKTRYFLRDNHQTDLRKNCNNEHVSVKSSPHILDLPNEILTMIFSYLSTEDLVNNIMLICKRLKDVAITPVLWRHLEFVGGRVPSGSALRLLEMSPLLKSIVIHNRNDFESLLNAVVHTNRRVEHLSLKMCPSKPVLDRFILRKCCNLSPSGCSRPPCCKSGGVIRSTYINNVLKYCTKIKHLELINLNIRSKKFFGGIGLHLKELTNLCIVNCDYFLGNHLTIISDNCHSLSHLTILNSFWPDDDRVDTWNEAISHMLKTRGGTLRLLELDVRCMSDSTLENLSHCSRLQSLSLENAHDLSCRGVEAISHLRYLDHLQLHYACHVNKQTLTDLFSPGKLVLLQTLTLSKCCHVNDACLSTIASSCPNLEKLNVSSCHLVTDAGVELIFKNCRKLEHIDLLHTAGVKGSSFRLIPHETPSLRLLIIEDFVENVKTKYTNELLERFPSLKISRYY